MSSICASEASCTGAYKAVPALLTRKSKFAFPVCSCIYPVTCSMKWGKPRYITRVQLKGGCLLAKRLNTGHNAIGCRFVRMVGKDYVHPLLGKGQSHIFSQATAASRNQCDFCVYIHFFKLFIFFVAQRHFKFTRWRIWAGGHCPPFNQPGSVARKFKMSLPISATCVSRAKCPVS